MKTPEEIKKALRMCFQEATCLGRGCPYEPDCIVDNFDTLQRDALEYIQQLEERIDLMKLQMRGDCGTCKHRDEEHTCKACCDDEWAYHPLWEYEGLPGEDTYHEKPV